MAKLALGIEYDGQRFYGWQRQASGRTVQAVVEEALSKICAHPVRVHCAGRTDSGVHALEQVVHFSTTTARPDDAYLLGANRYLPEDVAILWVQRVADNFHARYSAYARHYQYRIYNHTRRSVFAQGRSLWITQPLMVNLMRKASKVLVGKHDFSAFRDSECQAKNPVKTIEFLHIIRRREFIIIDIKADAFLHHMVRNIVGTLIEVGQQNQPPDWVLTVLQSKDRRNAGATVKAHGLFFVKAYYPEDQLGSA